MTTWLSHRFALGLIVAGGVARSAAAQSDTSQRAPAVTVAAAEAAGVKLLGVFDANTGSWLGHAVVRDTLGREAMTSDGGIVALGLLQPVLGQYMLEIRKEGYAPGRFKLKADTAKEFLVALIPNPLGHATELPTVVTSERRLMLERDEGKRAGFFVRCQMIAVECVGQRDLDLGPTYEMSDFVGRKDGIRLDCQYTPCAPEMHSTIGDGHGSAFCFPTYFVNGFIWSTSDKGSPHRALDQFLNAATIQGIEIYLTGMPRPGRWENPKNDCGAIVIWTRGRKKPV